MRTLATMTRIEIALLLREPAALFFVLALPLLLLALNGGSGGNEPQAFFGGVGLVDALVPGLLLLVMCTSGLMQLPETLAGYRERGFLRRLRVSPLRPWQILGSHALTHLAVVALGLVLVVGLATAAFDLTPPASWPAAVAALAASAVMVVALGFALAAVAPTTRTTQAAGAAIYFPAIFLSGVVMPAEVLPDLAARVSQALPFTYGVEAIREAWTAGGLDATALAVLAGTTLLAVALGLRAFRWEPRYS
ncbi:MAG: ABC transporter permease [Actinomycetota bacterium]